WCWLAWCTQVLKIGCLQSGPILLFSFGASHSCSRILCRRPWPCPLRLLLFAPVSRRRSLGLSSPTDDPTVYQWTGRERRRRSDLLAERSSGVRAAKGRRGYYSSEFRFAPRIRRTSKHFVRREQGVFQRDSALFLRADETCGHCAEQ